MWTYLPYILPIEVSTNGTATQECLTDPLRRMATNQSYKEII